MEEVTLRVNVIVEGQHYPRGSVIDKALLPLHLRTNKYIARGAVHVNKVMPIDMIELGDEIEEQEESPMQELILPTRKRR
jgi:hypothetical protein